MSLCYDSEKWLMISLASVAISITVGLVLMQYAHGQDTQVQAQTGNNESPSMVDKLIEDMKNNVTIEKSYKAELINRLLNPTCPDGALKVFKQTHSDLSYYPTIELEDALKRCVAIGAIK